jgi:class 3 adenylate cyclase
MSSSSSVQNSLRGGKLRGKLKTSVHFVKEFHANSIDAEHFSSFVPLAVQEAISGLPNMYDPPENENDPSVILFADVSGFTKLSVKFSKEPEGAKKLASVLNNFFSIVIAEIQRFGGDVTKFSGDAVTVRWRCKPGENNLEDNMALLTLYATKCSLEAHAACKAYAESEGGDRLSLHCCIGAGQCTAVHVGGGNSRWEYVIYGDVLTQISDGMNEAAIDETVLSPAAWGHLQRWNQQGLIRASKHCTCMAVTLLDVDISQHPLPTECQYATHALSHKEILLLARYVPSAVYHAIANGHGSWLDGDMRHAAAMFIKMDGITAAEVTSEVLCRYRTACIP